MRLSEPKTITYYIEASPSPSPSPSPGPSTNSTMFWALTQRIDGTEKQTQELSIQSERQMGVIQRLTESQHQEHQAMTKLLSRIEVNEKIIEGIRNTTTHLIVSQQNLSTNQQDLATNQEQTEQQVQILEEKIETLTGRVRALEQREARGTLGNVSELDEESVQQQQGVNDPDDYDEGEDQLFAAPGSAIFTDAFGRRRRLCKYCGQDFGASWCNKHERNKICLRHLRR